MCRACWDRDPKKRPHFQEIYVELEKLVVRTGLRTWGQQRRQEGDLRISLSMENLFRPRLNNQEEEKFRQWATVHRSNLTADMQAQLPPLPPKRLRRLSTRPEIPAKTNTTSGSSLYSGNSSGAYSRSSGAYSRRVAVLILERVAICVPIATNPRAV